MSTVRFALSRAALFKEPPLIVYDTISGRAARRGWTLVGRDVTDPNSYQMEVRRLSPGLFQYMARNMDLVVVDGDDPRVPSWYSKFVAKVS